MMSLNIKCETIEVLRLNIGDVLDNLEVQETSLTVMKIATIKCIVNGRVFVDMH